MPELFSNPFNSKALDRPPPVSANHVPRLDEIEFAHRTDLERTKLVADIEARQRGQWMGWSISIVAAAGATTVALAGADPVWVALAGLPILANAKAVIGRQC